MATTEENLALIQTVTLRWVHRKLRGDSAPTLPRTPCTRLHAAAIEQFSTLFGTFRGKPAIARWYESECADSGVADRRKARFA